MDWVQSILDEHRDITDAARERFAGTPFRLLRRQILGPRYKPAVQLLADLAHRSLPFGLRFACLEFGIISLVEENHPLDVVPVKDRPASALSRTRFIVTVPRKFDAWLTVTNARAVVDATLDVAELER